VSKVKHIVEIRYVVYSVSVPKLWTATLAAHRQEVRDAILDTAAALVHERGLRAITMSEIAERTGIGRATLYHYYPDVETILVAWHERHVNAHIERLAALRDQPGIPAVRLNAVLEAYALIQHRRHASEAAALLHRDEHARESQEHLHDLVRGLLLEAVDTGDVRNDIAPDELAEYCLYALAAASSLPSEEAVRRLVSVTLAGLRPAMT